MYVWHVKNLYARVREDDDTDDDDCEEAMQSRADQSKMQNVFMLCELDE